MLRALVLAGLAALSACASGGGRFDIRDMQRRLDDRGIGFGITRVPGENAALFQIRFRTAEADDAADQPVTEADYRAAAEAAAPQGCRLNDLVPTPEGMKAVYDCAP
ncbi:MAG: hypothetical protein AB7O04_08690 [Hyphomonadaceae bacterium]